MNGSVLVFFGSALVFFASEFYDEKKEQFNLYYPQKEKKT